MKVFVSWSGDRSKRLALALREWLPMVLHYAEPWLSEADVEAGERWAQSVAKELATSNFGIICVTSENVNSPWVLFEAGALTKSLETSKVIPLLFDLEFTDISGPLAQFQAKKLSRVGVAELVHSVQSSAEDAIPKDRADQLFEALWPRLEASLAEIPEEPPTGRHARPQHEVLEELVASIRALDSRVRESEQLIADLPSTGRRPRPARFHPVMVRELEHVLADGPDDAIGLVVLASLLREDVPWLYELTMEAYRSISSRRRDAGRTIDRLVRAVDRMQNTPFFEELGGDPRVLEVLTHELPRYLHRYSGVVHRGEASGAAEPN